MSGLLVAEDDLECACGVRATNHDFTKQHLALSIGNDDISFEYRISRGTGPTDDQGIPVSLAHGHVEPGVSFVACAWTHYGNYNSVSVHLFDDRRDLSPRLVVRGIGHPVQFVEFNGYANRALRYTEWTEDYPNAPIGEWLVGGKHTLLRRSVSLNVMTGIVVDVKLQPFFAAPNVRDMKPDGERWVPVYPDLYPNEWTEPPTPSAPLGGSLYVSIWQHPGSAE
jgi:hypothetical protein